MKMKKGISVLLAVTMMMSLVCGGVTALPAGLVLDEGSKALPSTETIRTADSLSDGEVYTYTTASDTDLDEVELPLTDFMVSLNAIGQQYRSTTTSTRSYNIVFVLDVSGSMTDKASSSDEDIKAETMVNTANDNMENFAGAGGNQIGVVAFSDGASTLVPLTGDSFTLSLSYRSSWSGTTVTLNTTTGSSKTVTGGTNIQAGLNAAYWMLHNASNSATAIPVIVLISDGVPCYYSTNYTSIPTASSYPSSGWSQDGDGRGDGVSSSSGVTAASYTIKQAKYLTTQMDDLQIYTVGFETANNVLATATLNPTTSNVAAVTGSGTRLSSKLSGDYYYPTGAFNASNSVDSLGTALQNIITIMQLKTPIAEAEENGVLNPASYVQFNYTLGTGYTLLGDTMYVRLNGINYPFTNHGTSYTYDVIASNPSFNPKMEKLVVTVSGGVLTFQVPASVLPCNSPEPIAEGEVQTLASPVSLNFVLQLNENDPTLVAGVYATASACTASFYPTWDNTYYYTVGATSGPTSIAENVVTPTLETVYYEATYPYPGHDRYGQPGYGLPTLTGFAVGSSADSVVYQSNPSAVPVTSYSDYSTDSYDVMHLTYEGEDIQFNGADYAQATVSVTTSNLTNPAAYTVTSFNDGYRNFDDATVTAVSGSDLTIAYNGGKQSVTIEDVSITTDYTTEYAYAVFDAKSANPNTTPLSNVQISSFKIGSTTISSGYSVNSITKTNSKTKINGTNYYYYNINVSYLGNIYTFNSIQFYKSGYISDMMTATRQVPSGYEGSGSDHYYFTSTSLQKTVLNTVVNYELIYNDATDTLTVRTGTGGVLSTEAVYAASGSTTITQNADGGYTIANTVGTTKTVTTYSISGNSLMKTVATTNGLHGINLATGVVTQSLSGSGTLTVLSSLNPSDFISSATLRSEYGSGVAMADSEGVATVVLTLQVSQSISNLDIDLGSSVEDGKFLTPVLVSGPTASTLAAGTYSFTYQVTYDVSNGRPDYYSANIGVISFTPGGSAGALQLAYDSENASQAVKIMLVAPSGH